MCLVKCFWFPVIYPKKFAVSGRSRLDKSAEVSACKRHMPDTCAFVPTSCKTFPDKYWNSKSISIKQMKMKLHEQYEIQNFSFLL